MFGADFPNYQKPGLIVRFLNCSLRKTRKTTNNRMNALCGIILQKSIVTHKVVSKNYYNERKNDMRQCFYEVLG